MSLVNRLLRSPWTWFLALTVAGFAVAARYVEPAPPRRLVMATGSEQGAYHAFGLRYQAALAAYDIELELRPSAGSVENLALLSRGAAQLAFAQGGSAPEEVDEQLVGLATVFHEPLWIFHERSLPLRLLSDLAGRRVDIGPVGSGTRAVALELLGANGVDAGSAELSSLASGESADRLLAGELDAAFFVAAASSPLVQRLAASETLSLLDVARGLSYERHFRYLQSVVLDEGMLDLAANRPPSPARMLAPLASLVARADLHPAIVHLVLEAARDIHGTGGLFEESGEYPSTEGLELPLSAAADRYFRHGPSFLYMLLPFWVASLVDRLKIMLLPLVTLLLPLLRVAPPVYRWRIRSRIYRWYRVLRQIEQEWTKAGPSADHEGTLARIRKIRDEVDHVSVPPSYGEEFYNLRMHLARLRMEIERASAG